MEDKRVAEEIIVTAEDEQKMASRWIAETRKELRGKSKNELIRLNMHLIIELYKEKEKNEKVNANTADTSVSTNGPS